MFFSLFRDGNNSFRRKISSLWELGTVPVSLWCNKCHCRWVRTPYHHYLFLFLHYFYMKFDHIFIFLMLLCNESEWKQSKSSSIFVVEYFFFLVFSADWQKSWSSYSVMFSLRKCCGDRLDGHVNLQWIHCWSYVKVAGVHRKWLNCFFSL